MALIITSDSHTDHNLDTELLDKIVEKYSDRNEFFIDSFELEGAELQCALHGPVMGDDPVPEEEVEYVIRGERGWSSRLCGRATRPTNVVTVIAGPHEDMPCVLYTAFGGPLAPKEPGDPTHDHESLAESEKFWAQHALSK